MADNQSSKQKNRLWILEGSLYPPKITIYLKEKGIADDFDIVPVTMSRQGQSPAPGKPLGSLPILELSPGDDTGKGGTFIFQSRAILEYFEDAYAEQLPRMHGKTPYARARVRECMDMLEEACTYFTAYVRNASPLFQNAMSQSEDAARYSLGRMHKALSQLDQLVDDHASFLVDIEQGPSILDCSAIGLIRFAENLFGVDLTESHPALLRAAQFFKQRASADLSGAPLYNHRDVADKLTVK